MTNLPSQTSRPGFLKNAFHQAKIVVGALIPVLPTLYGTGLAQMSTPDMAVINGLVMGVSFCASMAFNNRAHFPSLTQAYEYYSNKNYDSYGAAAMMAVLYTELTLLHNFTPLPG